MKLSSSCLISLAASVLIGTAPATAADSLEAGFQHPPDSAKPQTWWHWMNGNITKEGITADLEAMKRVGVGGAQIFNADCGIPAGPVKFMSAEWREMFKHAVQEADRLGLQLCVHNCAGWSSSGGPWNTPERAMQQIVTSESTVKGPAAFSDVLPQPTTRLGFYRDIAVLAFPLPPAERAAMRDFSAKATLSTGEDPGTKLTDGDASTYVTLPLPTSEHPQYAQLEFAQPFKARTLKVIGARRLPQPSGVVQVSDDGVNFRDLRTFSVGKRNSLTVALTPGAEPASARFWRVKFTSASANNGPIELADLQLSGASAIENLEAKAGFDGNTVPAAASFPALGPDDVIKQAAILDLTSRLQADGRLQWDAPAGEWLILRVGYTPTGRNNHPAPPEATGLECDKFSRQALDLHWAGFMQKIIADAGPLAGKSFNNALIDSYEVGGQNWSPAFREEFRKLRGYDLLRFLPSFSGRVVDSPEITERFLWDMRRTIADLFAENYYGHFRELCRQNGLLASIEPYTGPFESLQCGAAADLVMGEFWSNSQGHPSVKLASSVAHIYGKTIVGAESFTGNPNNAGKWLEDPYSLKALGDLMYCWGLNRFIFHRYAMQPWTNRWPGMTMGQWGFHFDRTSTWWEQGRAWIEYCTRCQFLLQQGRSVADVAYFCGESAPVEMRSGHPPIPNGYDYDAINADVLLHHASVQDGRLTLDGGASYRVLILPPDDPAITPRLLKRIRDLVRAGLIVLGAPPAHSPSLEDFPRCDAQVKALAAEMWGEIAAGDRVAADVSRRTISKEKLAPTDVGGYTATEHACGRGKVAWNKSLEEVLAEAGEKPDFAFSSGSPDAKLVYVHRADKGADIYFVSNQRHNFDTSECTFRVSGRTPELWHPDTGLIEPAPVWSESAAGNAAADDKPDGRTRVRLQLDPAGSVFVVFRERSRGDHLVEAKSGLGQNDDWQVTLAKNGAPEITSCTNGSFELTTATGKKLKADLQDVPPPSEIAGPWTLRFPANWGAPAEVTLTNLTSWTEYPGNGVRYFSGTATYSNELSISPEMLSNIRNVWLDLGRVKNIAEVVLNGRSLGILWKPPFRVDLTSAAHPGVNRLELKVTNLWPNRLIGDEQLPPDCEWNGKQLKEWPAWLLSGKPSPTGRLTFTTWHHWTKDSPLLESGLLGPVTLRVAEKATAVTMQ